MKQDSNLRSSPTAAQKLDAKTRRNVEAIRNTLTTLLTQIADARRDGGAELVLQVELDRRGAIIKAYRSQKTGRVVPVMERFETEVSYDAGQ